MATTITINNATSPHQAALLRPQAASTAAETAAETAGNTTMATIAPKPPLSVYHDHPEHTKYLDQIIPIIQKFMSMDRRSDHGNMGTLVIGPIGPWSPWVCLCSRACVRCGVCVHA